MAKFLGLGVVCALILLATVGSAAVLPAGTSVSITPQRPDDPWEITPEKPADPWEITPEKPANPWEITPEKPANPWEITR